MGHWELGDPRQEGYREKRWTEIDVGSYPKPRPSTDNSNDGEPEPLGLCGLPDCDAPLGPGRRKFCSDPCSTVSRQRRRRNCSPEPDSLVLQVVDADFYRQTLQDDANRKPGASDVVPFRIRICGLDGNGWSDLEVSAERAIVESFGRR